VTVGLLTVTSWSRIVPVAVAVVLLVFVMVLALSVNCSVASVPALLMIGVRIRTELLPAAIVAAVALLHVAPPSVET
jgi:hypothetical protein